MFGHLQIKSAYSFQRSTILIKDLVKMAKEKHIDALALCDKDNMYGAYEFYEECTKANIKPIFGLEATVLINGEHYPMTLLAIDDQGYFDSFVPGEDFLGGGGQQSGRLGDPPEKGTGDGVILLPIIIQLQAQRSLVRLKPGQHFLLKTVFLRQRFLFFLMLRAQRVFRRGD